MTDSRGGPAELLNLDPNVVLRAAELNEAFAGSYLQRYERVAQPYDSRDDSARSQQDQPFEGALDPQTFMRLGASCLVHASAYRSLLSPLSSRPLFVRAADLYELLGHSYSVVLATVASHQPILNAHIQKLTNEVETSALPLTPEQLTFSMFAAIDYASTSDLGAAERITGLLGDRSRAFAATPIGRLRLPMGIYADVLSSMNESPSDRGRHSVQVSLFAYLNAAGRSMDYAMRDTYHWRRLQSGLLPVEPEAVAVAMSAAQFMRRHLALDIREMPWDDRVGLAHRVPAYVAGAMLSDNDQTMTVT
jgi:hypothetical protein